MKKAKDRTHGALDNSKEVLSVLKTIEGHLASMVYYQNPSRGTDTEMEKYAAQAYIGENKKSQDDLRTMIMEELQKLIEETK